MYGTEEQCHGAADKGLKWEGASEMGRAGSWRRLLLMVHLRIKK